MTIIAGRCKLSYMEATHMQNLIARKDAFRFNSKPEGEIVRVEVYYSKGGMNYWNYKQEPRGIYVSVSSLKVERGENFTTEAYTMGTSGAKLFVSELQRKTASKIQAVAEKVDAVVPQVAELFTTDRQAAFQLLKSTLGVL